MAKFYGEVGYSETAETSAGVWTEVITERMYYGDIRKVSKRTVGSEGINDDLLVSNEISILADPFACHNFCNMKYVVWGGVRWKISGVIVNFPRITLSLGGVYNGNSGPTAYDTENDNY